MESGRQLNEEPEKEKRRNNRSGKKRKKAPAAKDVQDDNVEETLPQPPKEIQMVHIGTFYVSSAVSNNKPMSPFHCSTQKNRLKTNRHQYLTLFIEIKGVPFPIAGLQVPSVWRMKSWSDLRSSRFFPPRTNTIGQNIV